MRSCEGACVCLLWGKRIFLTHLGVVADDAKETDTARHHFGARERERGHATATLLELVAHGAPVAGADIGRGLLLAAGRGDHLLAARAVRGLTIAAAGADGPAGAVVLDLADAAFAGAV